MKKLLLLALLCTPLYAQLVRVDPNPVVKASGNYGPGGYPQLLGVPGAQIAVCADPSNGLPCTNYAVTYSDATGSTACPSNAPIVMPGTNQCTSVTDNTGSFGFWIASGNYDYTVTLPNGNTYGPYPITPGGSGGGGGSYDPCTAPPVIGEIYASCFGVSAANADNRAALQLAFNAAYNPANPGQATPQVIQLPPGVLRVCGQVPQATLTTVLGTGRGDPSTLVPPFGNATVIQASPGCWVGGTTLGANNSVWLQGGFGSTSTESFASRLFNVALDGGGVAGGLFRANCQEKCTTEGIIATNLKYYGFADWGASNNSNNSGTNAPFGLPAQFQGSANDGPDRLWEIYPYGGSTSTFHPIWLLNVAGYKGIETMTIATPGTDDAGHEPDDAGQVSGDGISLKGIHMEGPKTGIIVGPTGLFNGASNVVTENVDFATAGITNGCTFVLQQPKGFTALATKVGSGVGHRVCNQLNSQNDDSSSYFFDIRSTNSDQTYFSLLGGLSLDTLIQTTNDITAQGKVTGGNMKIFSTAPCLVLQYAAATPFVFPSQTSCIDINGDSTWTFTAGPHGDQYYQGPQRIAMGIGRNLAGLNMSAPEYVSGGNSLMAVLGSNLSWDGATSDFFVSNNGQPDTAGWLFDLTGVHFAGQNGITTGTHYPLATVQGWESVHFLNNGTQQYGNSSVVGTVATWTNSTGTCSLNPATGFTGACAGGGGGASNLAQLTDFKTTIVGTNGAVAASTLPTYQSGTKFPPHAAASWTTTGAVSDHIYIDQTLAGNLEFIKNAANTYTLTGFDVAVVTGTGFTPGALPLVDCAYAGSVYTCTDDRPFITQNNIQAQGGGMQFVPAVGGGLVGNYTNLVTNNTNTTYATDPFLDWGAQNNFNTAVNGAAAVTLPQANTPGTCTSGTCNFPNGWSTIYANTSITGSSVITITANVSVLYGLGVAGSATLQISPGQAYKVTSDGTNFHAAALYAGSGGGGGSFSGITSGTNVSAAMICGTGCSLATSGAGTLTANNLAGVASSDLTDASNLAYLNTSNVFSVPQFITQNGGSNLLTLTNTTAATGDSTILFLGPSSKTGNIGILNSGGCVNNVSIVANGVTAACWSNVNGSMLSFKSIVMQSGAALVESQNTTTFSTTPAFNAALGNNIYITLTNNVSSSTISGGSIGQVIRIFILEDATGGRTFVPPATSHGWPAITTTALQMNVVTCELRTATDCWATGFLSYAP